MKRIFLTLLVCLFYVPAVLAAVCVIDGIYDVQFDTKLNGKIDKGFTTTQIKFNKNPKNARRFSGKYVKPYRKHAYNGACYTLDKSIVNMVYSDKGNGYFSTYSLTEIGKDKFKGAWTDVRGNTGDYIMTKKSGVSSYMKLDKKIYSSVIDGVLKVHFDLPGHEQQKICVAPANAPVDKNIRCTSFETSGKKKGAVDFYVPQPPGEYEVRFMFAADSVKDHNARMKELSKIRQKIRFTAVMNEIPKQTKKPVPVRKVTKKPEAKAAAGKHIKLSKNTYSKSKDKSINLTYSGLPGYKTQRVCMTHADGKIIFCSFYDLSEKKQGTFSFQNVPEPGNYAVVLNYYDTKAKNKPKDVFEIVRDRVTFKVTN